MDYDLVFFNHELYYYKIVSKTLIYEKNWTFKQELDKLYSPSQYNRRMTADEVITEHIRVITDESSRIRTGTWGPHIQSVSPI